MLASNLAANYRRISTWRGSYAVRSESIIPGNTRQSQAIGAAPQSDVRAYFDCICRFSIDLSADSCFLTVEDGKQMYYDEDTGAPAEVIFERPTEQRCVLTAEHFLELRPDNLYQGFGPLKGFELPPKRTVFRDEPSKAGFSLFTNFVDPRLFFHINRNLGVWEEFEKSYIPALQGDLGSEQKDLFDAKLSLSMSTRDGEIWYRATQRQSAVGGPVKEQVFLSSAGFNRTQLVVWKRDSVSQRYRYRYRFIDDIYVPEHIIIEYAGLEKKRELTLQDCVLNGPIDLTQFSYEALGIKEGDLIMDRIEQVAYEYKSGEPKKLANFGEGPPKETSNDFPKEPSLRALYVVLGLMAVLAVLIAIKLFARLARR